MKRVVSSRAEAGAIGLIAAFLLVGCGGGGDNPLGNPPLLNNPPQTSGQKLSFVYYQRCVNPVFLLSLQVNQGGALSNNTCASSGCHDSGVGPGGAFRVVQSALPVPDTDTAEAKRATDMYKNFISSQGSTVIGGPAQSRLLNKPLVRGVLHGGGLIFASDQDPNARLLRYWISRPVPDAVDEFSADAGAAMLNADGSCKTD